MKKRFLAILLVLALLLGFVACASPAAPVPGADAPPPGGGTADTTPTPTDPGKDYLVFALNQEPAGLDPYTIATPQGFIVSTLIHETLIKRADDGSFIPWLATSWEQVDELTFHFNLRNDVYFHDGTKFTADDAAYSLGVGATSSFTIMLFGNIDPEATRALDDYTLELVLTAPYAPLFEALATFRAAMMSRTAREAMGEEAYGRAPVGTGPMRFVEWVSGDRIELAAHEAYWGEALPFTRATARFLVEGSARTIALETGGVDIAFDLPIPDWDRIDANAETVLVAGESQSHSFLLLNNSMEPTTDIRVRRALAHALDMEALVRVAYQGQAVVADSFFAPNIFAYKPVGPYEFNQDLARELLAEAGFPNGFSIDFHTMENQLNMTMAEIVQNMWGQVGVDVTINIVDLATQTQLNNDGRIHSAIMAPTIAMADPDAGLTIWPVHRTISIRHNDQHVQDLLDAGRTTWNEAERIAIYHELQEYLFYMTYSIPVAFPRIAFGTRSNIYGMQFAPSGVPDLTQIRFA